MIGYRTVGIDENNDRRWETGLQNLPPFKNLNSLGAIEKHRWNYMQNADHTCHARIKESRP